MTARVLSLPLTKSCVALLHLEPTQIGEQSAGSHDRMKVVGFWGPLGIAFNVVGIVVHVLREVWNVVKFGVTRHKFEVLSI